MNRFILVMLLLICIGAEQVQGQKALAKCLSTCGESILKCALGCAPTGMPQLAKCILKCGVANFSCMEKCVGSPVRPPPPPPPPSPPLLPVH
ncbi:hypothetical protein JCGZ_26890 [Jatropha curcas]|uniref:Uncharacterized protein n=1 Tax=Jatropha curcas TaxID=180498 RepID=A0A067L0C6_JATCU|nr:hypothetical protein JCGZ_26890 [Jatropha curcas]